MSSREDIEEIATLIAAAFPHPGGGSYLVWEDCFPAAEAILDAGFHK